MREPEIAKMRFPSLSYNSGSTGSLLEERQIAESLIERGCYLNERIGDLSLIENGWSFGE
ncbi:hypothetical protein [Tunturiibacter psychrotolerans]|uniref:hypothetical protein n=1 Tax=Tunturiibacter psychrotolerans TaxID=3069686 RepID=UPI003D240416